MQREEGAQGRARFQYYQKLGAFVFAIAQAVGQLTYIRPYVDNFTPEWLFGSTCALVAGAMALVYIADTISELKLGNGTSVIIFAGIASALPSSVGQLVAQNAGDDPTNVVVYVVAFFLTTLGIIYVQEAERRIPINYSNRYTAGNLARQSYLPFKARQVPRQGGVCDGAWLRAWAQTWAGKGEGRAMGTGRDMVGHSKPRINLRPICSDALI
eukprot:363670-Chlamydomonas_euryale.AAC.23